MQEIAPGLWHWTALHPHIDKPVSSYYLLPERVLLDPMLPPPGIDWFIGLDAEPEHIPAHQSPSRSRLVAAARRLRV